jgi:hypothetical protein
MPEVLEIAAEGSSAGLDREAALDSSAIMSCAGNHDLYTRIRSRVTLDFLILLMFTLL